MLAAEDVRACGSESNSADQLGSLTETLLISAIIGTYCHSAAK
jgi:hypothetical protein